MMIGVAQLLTYRRGVPAMGADFGAPSNTGGVIFAELRWTVAVWGMPLAMRASRAPRLSRSPWDCRRGSRRNPPEDAAPARRPTARSAPAHETTGPKRGRT